MSPRTLPDNPHPEAQDRFERLMGIMAPQAVEKFEEGQKVSDQDSDEDYSDTQTQTDTSENAS